MIDTVLGLPSHPLFVHAAVVLLPLLAIATAALAWLPARWRSWGVAAVVLDAAAVGLAVVAKESGERLEHRIAGSPQIEEHAELGELLPYFAVLLVACAIVMALLGRREPHAAGERGRWLPLAVALGTTVLAIVTLYWTARVGHSGAVAVWGDLAP